MPLLSPADPFPALPLTPPGGPALTLVCVYILALEFGWL